MEYLHQTITPTIVLPFYLISIITPGKYKRIQYQTFIQHTEHVQRTHTAKEQYKMSRASPFSQGYAG